MILLDVFLVHELRKRADRKILEIKCFLRKVFFFLKELLIFCVVPWNKRNAPAREQSNKVKTRMAKKWDRCVLVENMTL